MKKLLGALTLSLVMVGGASAQVSQDQMQADMIAPVVRIVVHTEDGESTGSGTIIYSGQRNGHIETYILTNNHVVDDSVSVEHNKLDAKALKIGQIEVDQFVYNSNGLLISKVSKPAKVVAFDADGDLAVVKLTDDVNVLPTAILTKDDAVRVFDKVYVVGAGLGNPPFPGEGIISQTDTEEDGHRTLQVTAPVIMGNSGGALFRFEAASGHYELIGVPEAVAAYPAGLLGHAVDQNMGYAIPASTVRSFLKEVGLDFVVGDDAAVGAAN